MLITSTKAMILIILSLMAALIARYPFAVAARSPSSFRSSLIITSGRERLLWRAWHPREKGTVRALGASLDSGGIDWKLPANSGPRQNTKSAVKSRERSRCS